MGGAARATPAEVAAFGDNLNDVEMLDYAGTAYIMGNAIDSLKSRRVPPGGEQRRGRPGARGQGLPNGPLTRPSISHLAISH